MSALIKTPIAFIILFLCLCSHTASAALAIDGTNTSTGTPASIGISLVTSNSNDCLIVLVKNGLGNGTVTGLTDNGPGLIWTRRAIIGLVAGGAQSFEEWYAVSPGAFNATITANISSGSTISRLAALGISGCNTITPFDPNVSLAATNSSTSTPTSLAPSSAFSTSNSANDMIISYLTISGSSATNPTGYTTAFSVSTTTYIAYSIVSGAQSGLSPAWTSITGSSVAEGIWDAVQTAPVIGSPPINNAPIIFRPF